MTHDPTFVAIIERNLQYFTAEIAAADVNARQFLQSERENIYDAVKFAARIPQANYAAALLLTQIGHLIEQNDAPSQWSQVFIRVLNRYECADSRTICDLYNRLGRFSRQAGEYRRSLKIYEKSLQIASQNNDMFDMANAEYGISMNYFRLADIASTQHRIKTAKQYIDGIDQVDAKVIEVRGNIYNVMGLAALNLREFEEAYDAFDEAARLMKQSNSHSQLGLVLLNKAQLLCNLGEVDRAMELTQLTIEEFEVSGDWLSSCDAKIMLGGIHIWCKRWQAALDVFESISVYELRKRGHHKRCANVHNNIGNAFYFSNNLKAAQQHLTEAASIHRDNDPSPDLAAAIAMLALVNASLGLRKQAQENILESEGLLDNFQKTLLTEEIRSDLTEAKQKLKLQRRAQFRQQHKDRNI